MLAGTGGAPFDRLLLALAAEFKPVDSAAALEQLDELARQLFGIASGDTRSTAERIAATLAVEAGMRPAHDFDGLFFDRVLARRRGNPALLAAMYVEVARRAGVSLCLLSSPRRWLVGLLDNDTIVVVDPASPVQVRAAHDPLGLRSHCAHGLADANLSALTRRFRSLGRIEEARHAARLRLLLPLSQELLAHAREELRALDTLE